MRPGRSPLVLAAVATLAVLPLPACGRGSAAHAEAAPTTQATSPLDRLPEDPALGAKATAEWRAFMKEEERERKLRFDRDRLEQHRKVLGLIVRTRARLDRAKTRAALTSLRERLPPAIEDIRRHITAIDHWGVNSNLLPDYDAILAALADGYPAARLAALDGDGTSLTALRAELDRRQKAITDWLAEAAATEDE